MRRVWPRSSLLSLRPPALPWARSGGTQRPDFRKPRPGEADGAEGALDPGPGLGAGGHSPWPPAFWVWAAASLKDAECLGWGQECGVSWAGGVGRRSQAGSRP